VVVSERGNLSHHLFHGRRRFRLRLRGLPPLLRRMYPRADAIVCVSDGVARDLASLTGVPAARMRTVYNPVVTPELLAQAEAIAPHPWLQDGGPPVVLGVGRLVDQKGFATLLEAVARLRRERPLRLLVLGEGRRRGALERQARRLGLGADFALPGFAPNPFAYMARAGVFVLSSVYEGLPGVLIQALACGCPVVSTDCPDGPREILAGGEYGPLVPVGDAAALAAAIGRVLDAPPDRERLRRRGQAFGVEPAVLAYLEVVDAAVARRTRALSRRD
jgi:glycosyltransferase involved in cell wall biosynthesis